MLDMSICLKSWLGKRKWHGKMQLVSVWQYLINDSKNFFKMQSTVLKAITLRILEKP
jgi:hypothetical protein